MVSKIYMCELNSRYVRTLEVDTGANPTNTDFNSPFSVIDRLCLLVKNGDHTIYMDRWFSSPKLFDYLWAYIRGSRHCHAQHKGNAKAGIFQETKKRGKIVAHRDHFMAIK
jgi:hypothetical protein